MNTKDETNKQGGRRAGSGRKPLPDAEKKRHVQLYLLPREEEKVLAFLEKLRRKKGV
jgi:hypothetical protein